MFKPITGRSPKARAPDTKNQIGEHLYQYHSIVNEKHKKLVQDEELKLAEMRRQIHQNNKKSD